MPVFVKCVAPFADCEPGDVIKVLSDDASDVQVSPAFFVLCDADGNPLPDPAPEA